jgi:hypothetical protein
MTRQVNLNPGERVEVYCLRGETPQRKLNAIEWDALARAEDRISESSYISYTSVAIREEDRVAGPLWDHTQAQMDAAGDFETNTGEELSIANQRVLVARRVARALAVAVFGPEFLLK